MIFQSLFMQTRKQFLKSASLLSAGLVLLPHHKLAGMKKVTNAGIQLYSFKDDMARNPQKTLEMIAKMGFKQIESAKSQLGHYYGLSAAEMKNHCTENGLTLRSGHVQVDEKWKDTLNEAEKSGQEFLVCSSMPTNGQTILNYQKVAEKFNKAGSDCRKRGIKFGYHNHDYEFDTVNGKVLYDVLLTNTDPDLVHMELDLGWVIAAGKDPLLYFKNYPGRFPLWHLKDMNIAEKHSVELGQGQLDIKSIFREAKLAGMKYFFVEQEEFAHNPADSMKQNMLYLNNLDY